MYYRAVERNPRMKALLVATQVAWILLLVGAIVLLFFREIYLDAETKQPIKFFVLLFGEISTRRRCWCSY
jgi:hypothetical protein